MDCFVVHAPRKPSAIKLLLMVLLFVVHSNVSEAKQSYFVMRESRSSDITPFYKWTSVLSRYAQQQNVSDEECGRVQFHPCTIPEWKQWLERLRDRPLQEKISEVNKRMNRSPYILDQNNWGMSDYWETPYEFFSISGDCEDYAISKYYSLRLLGVSMDDMRIIILQDFNLGGIIHAVLGVYDAGTLYILDNQIQQVMPATKIYHYRPIYGVNEEAWWSYQPL